MKVKRKIRLTKIGKLVFGLLIIILVLLCIPTVVRKINYNKLINIGYSEASSSYIIKHKLFKSIKDLDYIETLDKVIGSNNYKDGNYDKYIAINYYDSDNFSESINKFIDLGYSTTDINNIRTNR